MEQKQSAAQQVLNNEYLLEQIVKHLNVEERIKAQTTCRIFYKVFNDYVTNSNTLKIIEIESNIKYLINVRFDDKVKTYRLKNEHFTEALQDNILEWLTEDRLPLIRKVLFRGRLIENPIHSDEIQIRVSVNFGSFLDHFPNLKHLECTNLNLSRFLNQFIRPENYQFHRRIKTLNVVGSKCLFLSNIVANNLSEVHMTESATRHEMGIGNLGQSVGIMNSAPNAKFVVYIDDPFLLTLSGFASDGSPTPYLQWYYRRHIKLLNSLEIIPYHLMFRREINFYDSKVPNLKFAKNITLLTMMNFNKNSKGVNNAIRNLPNFPKLEKLRLHGLLTSENVKNMIKYIKKCKSLKRITIECLPHTDENRKNIANFVKHLPQQIVNMDLVNCVKKDVIEAFKAKAARKKFIGRNKFIVRSRFVGQNKFLPRKKVRAGYGRTAGRYFLFVRK